MTHSVQMSVLAGMLICMRTTLNLADGLVVQAKAHAAATGQTLTSLVEQGLRLVLERHDIPGPAAPEPLPTYGRSSGGIFIDLADRDAVWEALGSAGQA